MICQSCKVLMEHRTKKRACTEDSIDSLSRNSLIDRLNLKLQTVDAPVRVEHRIPRLAEAEAQNQLRDYIERPITIIVPGHHLPGGMHTMNSLKTWFLWHITSYQYLLHPYHLNVSSAWQVWSAQTGALACSLNM